MWNLSRLIKYPTTSYQKSCFHGEISSRRRGRGRGSLIIYNATIEMEKNIRSSSVSCSLFCAKNNSETLKLTDPEGDRRFCQHRGKENRWFWSDSLNAYSYFGCKLTNQVAEPEGSASFFQENLYSRSLYYSGWNLTYLHICIIIYRLQWTI